MRLEAARLKKKPGFGGTSSASALNPLALNRLALKWLLRNLL